MSNKLIFENLNGRNIIQNNWQGARINKTVNLKEMNSVFAVHFYKLF